MKDDEKKSQREDMQFPDEEDMDFEILDALEQLDESGSQQNPDISNDTIDLTLDDDDMHFGDNAPEAGNSFSFDDSLREGLEQELLQDDSDFNIDDSLEDDLVGEIQAEAGEDSFALDFDLDSELSDEEIDVKSDDPAFDMSDAETLAFNFKKQNREARMPSQEDESLDEFGSYDLDLGSESDDIDLKSFSSSDDDFQDLDLGIEGVEISEEFADLGADIDFDSSPEEERGDENIQGKTVIAVGDDEVIDLGDEEHLQLETEAEQLPEPSLEEETAPDSDIMLDLHKDDDEEFMASLGDIQINLENEEDVFPEEVSVSATPEEKEVEEAPYEDESMEVADLAEEELPVPESTDMTELVKEVLESREAENDDENTGTPEAEEETEIPATEEELGLEAEEISEESAEVTPVEEVDIREFLGLSLSLSDEQIEEFEAMVNEAKTLQVYLDELEEHHTDVKENIYHKLQLEYIARKTVIFKSPEFTSLLADVERDLEDMLTKRADFVETVGRLNEELEEIKVRHLVGEFDDSTLDEKQESQNAEITLWNEKTEKIEIFITRYQESLEAEKALNPLRQEDPESPVEEEPQQDAETASAEEIGEPAETPEAETTEEAETIEEDRVEETRVGEEEEEEDFPEEVGMEDESSVLVSEADPSEEGQTPEEETESEPGIEDFFATSGEGLEDDEELDEEFPMDGDFETGDFVLDDLSGFEDDEEEDDASVAYEVEGFGDDNAEAVIAEEADMVACSKCGRQTPAAEKFCVHCGGKAQKVEQDANVSCKKCGRQTSAAEKFCTHCGGKAQ